MSKRDSKKEETVESSTEIIHEGRPLNPPPPPTETQLPTGESPVDFNMYCSIKNVPIFRRAGMRAYTDRKAATVAEWDAIFSTY